MLSYRTSNFVIIKNKIKSIFNRKKLTYILKFSMPMSLLELFIVTAIRKPKEKNVIVCLVSYFLENIIYLLRKS